MKNFYAILNISQSASPETVKNAYRLLAKKYHPDLNPNDKEAEMMFLQIQEAYNTLSNTLKRNHYDYKLQKSIQAKQAESYTSKKSNHFQETLQFNSLRQKERNQEKEKQKENTGKKEFFSADTYKNKIEDLMAKQQELIDKQKKNAEYERKKQDEKTKTFYDTFRENREKAIFEQKNIEKKKAEEQEKESQMPVPKKSRVGFLWSILGFKKDE